MARAQEILQRERTLLDSLTKELAAVGFISPQRLEELQRSNLNRGATKNVKGKQVGTAKRAVQARASAAPSHKGGQP